MPTTSRNRFATLAAEHGWTVQDGDDWIVTYVKGRRRVTVQFTVGSTIERPVGATAANSHRSRRWSSRRYSGPLVDWVVEQLASPRLVVRRSG